MDIPLGYGKNVRKGQVCRLTKALCGPKQSPRTWFGTLTCVMHSMGYKQSQRDHTLFITHSNSELVAILLVYVDDIITIGNDEEEKQGLKQRLATEFEIKGLGKLKYFLGIEVTYSKQGMFISQHKYITNLLRETRKWACKPMNTNIEFNHKLGDFGDDKMVNKRLIYLFLTRSDSDIACVVSVISQFMHNPRETLTCN